MKKMIFINLFSVFVTYFYYIKFFQIFYSTSYKLNAGIDIFIWHSKMICIHFLMLMLTFAIFKNCISDETHFLGLIYPTFILQTPTYSNNTSKSHILKSWTIKNFREFVKLRVNFDECFPFLFLVCYNALKYIYLFKMQINECIQD